MQCKIKEYVAIVCQQIRWKKARQRVSDEMTAHISDARDYYIEDGLDAQAATIKAISDTGDALLLGANFDRIHRPKPQLGMFAAVAAFLALGILASLLLHDGADVGRRLMFMGIGAVIMLTAYFVDFTILGKHAMSIFWGIVGVSIFITLSPRFFFHHTQIFTLLFPLVFAICIYMLRNKGAAGIILSGVFYSILGGRAIFLLPLTGFFHFIIIGTALFVVVIIKDWFGLSKLSRILLTIFYLATLTGITIFVIAMGPQTMRFIAAFNPSSDPLGFGFAATQIRLVLGGAALLGEGAITTAFLPDARANLLLTSVIAYYGWIPFAVIILALLVFIAVGFVRCFRQKSGLGFFVSFAVMATFAAQVLTYVLFNLGFTLGQISLPLISFGNTAMVVNMGLVGIMLSVFRTGDIVTEKELLQDSDAGRFLTWENGKLTINFNAR